ncbi:MAG: zinc ABC transporter substrate-binding protein [Micrococcales bacterium]|nr:zinc ABC transporter substrate-binding protein [Micrococcales bacterium]
MNRERTVNRRRTVLSAVLLVALVAGCTASSGDDDRLSVVTSTNVWGDVAAQVGGDLVDVTSIVAKPAADPHSYEASARDQLRLSQADLVVVNGGGYDDFALTLLDGLETRPPVVDAVTVSGHDGADLNEHVWYDLPTVAAVADQIAADLSRIDPDHADTYAANAAAFTAEIDTLVSRTQALAQTVGGQPVAVTEPVPGYLLDALGLVDQTPPQFAKAVEDETDVPPTVMRDTLALFTDHQVVLLVYNAQTTGPQTQQVRTAADAAAIPVVAVTETLPAAQTYITWMSANLDALAQALGVATTAPGAPDTSPPGSSTPGPDPASTP